MSEVLVVLTHWKRTENLVHQVRAFRAQSVPVTIAIVDNAEIPISDRRLREQYPQSLHEVAEAVDDVYTLRVNRGPSCRFVAPFFDLDHKYTLLYDDDALPGPGAVEHLVSVAGDLRDSFSELGVVGRNFAEDETGRPKYRRKDVDRSKGSQPGGTQWVHMIGRAHFFLTRLVGGVLELRRKLVRSGVDPRMIDRHDDLGCLGMTTVQLRPTLLPPSPDGCELIDRELPDDHAIHRQDGFIRERNEMLAALHRLKVVR